MAKSNMRISVLGFCVFVGLMGIVLFSAGASRVSLSQQSNKPNRNQRDAAAVRQELQARIPTTDYDSPESSDPAEKAKRSKRNKHYDKGNFVMRNPSNEGTATILNSEAVALPALPAAQSDVILTAEVLNSEAHLSNDKTGVYSEFNVQVDVVLKGNVSTLSQTNLISISRPGGVVRYPSGHIERYEIAQQNMPAVGRRYLFFLKAIPDSQDYEIVTGYEIGLQHVRPLDDGAQFESFRGIESVVFLNSVREAISKN